MQSDMDSILKQAGGETATEQTDTMAAGADVLAGQARQQVDDAGAMVNQARANFDQSINDLVSTFKDDLEFGNEIEKLEDLVGTEITKGQGDTFETVREGLKTACGTMTDRKDALYGAIPKGTPFDYEGFGRVLKEATENLNAFEDSEAVYLVIDSYRLLEEPTERLNQSRQSMPSKRSLRVLNKYQSNRLSRKLPIAV